MNAGTVASAAAGVQVILAAVLLILALRAWRRVRSGRIGALAVAMAFFLVQGVVLALSFLTANIPLETGAAVGLAANAVALAFVYVGVLRT